MTIRKQIIIRTLATLILCSMAPMFTRQMLYIIAEPKERLQYMSIRRKIFMLISLAFMLLTLPYIYLCWLLRLSLARKIRHLSSICCTLLIIYPILLTLYFRFDALVLILSTGLALIGISVEYSYEKGLFRFIVPFASSLSSLYGYIVAQDLSGWVIATLFYFSVFVLESILILSLDPVFELLR